MTTTTPTARRCDDFANWGIYYVDCGDKEYSVNSLGTPYVQVLLHATRKTPSGLVSYYTRRINPTGPLGRMLVDAAKTLKGA